MKTLKILKVNSFMLFCIKRRVNRRFTIKQPLQSLGVASILLIFSLLPGTLLAAVELAAEYTLIDRVTEGELSQCRLVVTLWNNGDEPIRDGIGYFLVSSSSEEQVSPPFGPISVAPDNNLTVTEFVTVPTKELEGWLQGTASPRLRIEYVGAEGEPQVMVLELKRIS